MDNVEVIGFNTLTVDFAREVGASVILKAFGQSLTLNTNFRCST